MSDNRELLKLLRACSFNELVILSCKVLARAGYGDIEVMDRWETHHKSRHGGFDLLCRTTIGDEQVKVVVKVMQDGARLRMLSELAGTLDLQGATMGILITPHVQPWALVKAKAFKRAQVTIWNGEDLCGYLRRFGLGVRPDGSLDYAFFGALPDVAERVLTVIQGLKE